VHRRQPTAGRNVREVHLQIIDIAPRLMLMASPSEIVDDLNVTGLVGFVWKIRVRLIRLLSLLDNSSARQSCHIRVQ